MQEMKRLVGVLRLLAPAPLPRLSRRDVTA